MILVRIIFQAKFGKGGELAAAMKRGQEVSSRVMGGSTRSRVLTDLSGQFDTVVQELEVESLAEWERQRAAVFSDPRFQEMMASTRELIEGGRQEFYTIEG